MTERIQFDFKDEYITLNGGVFATARTKLDAERISKVINEFQKENEQLKYDLANKECLIQHLKTALNTDYYKESKHYKKEFIRVCEELAEENNLYKQLKKENEQLKSENQKLMKALGESGKVAVEILLPKDEDSLTLNGKWW